MRDKISDDTVYLAVSKYRLPYMIRNQETLTARKKGKGESKGNAKFRHFGKKITPLKIGLLCLASRARTMNSCTVASDAQARQHGHSYPRTTRYSHGNQSVKQ